MKKNRKVNSCWQLIHMSLKGNRPQVILLVLLCFAGSLLPSITPLIYRQIVDQLIPSRDFLALYVYVAALIAIPVLNSLLFNWRNIAAYRLSEAVTRTLRLALFDKIAKMNYGAYLHMGSKSLVYRLTRGCGQIGDVFLNNTLLSLINASFSLVLVFIPMLILEYRLALVALLAFPIVYLLLVWVKKHVASRDKKLFQVLMKGEGMFHEALEGLRVMRLSGGKERQAVRISGWLQEHMKVKQASVKAHEFERASLPELCMQVLYGLIFILGAMLVMSDHMTVGGLVAFVAYIPRALGSIKELLLIQVTFKSVEPYFQSINEVFDIPDEPSGARIPEKIEGRLTFRNVCFTYSEESNFALQNLDFEVYPNEAVAIVGETGGGKSTLLDLILRFYEPTSGEILLDGVNVREYEISAYRAQFSVAQQSHFLWNDTLLANIIYPDEKPRMDDYERAVANAQITEFVNRLPQKDQTLLGEGRQAVSGGERQRISLAHAFYQDRRILLLDEPTSALDAGTEGHIRNVLLSYKGKKTIIVVTHRLSTILQYDRILVVKDGKIAESGAPDELLGQPSILRSLCEQQGLVLEK